jgi:hypothetical protein
MDGIISTFKSRYGDTRTVTQVDENTLIVEGTTMYTRGSDDDNGQVMVDFEGGPFLTRGMDIRVHLGCPMDGVIKTMRFLPSDRPNHAKVEVKIKPDKQR